MEADRSRKRLRRSTRSCYQCRKRKVKCQLTDENVETCAECVKSGTKCTLQPPETELNSGGSPTPFDRQEHDSRLERIESLLKKLVESQERSRTNESSSEPEPIVPPPLWDDFLLRPPTSEALVVDNHGFGMPELPGTLDAKQSLVALLPSAQDAVTIVTNTTAWLWGSDNPLQSVLTPDDNLQLLQVAAISSDSALNIAKSLLLFALYMQQLPASFDVQTLESGNIEKGIELIVERVKLYIVTHEDEAASMDGLECLILISLLHLNNGAIRKAWMTFRRAIDMSRLQGLPSSFSLSARHSTSDQLAVQRRVWLSAVCGDCYCSLLLGQEPGLGIAPFGPDNNTWKDPSADNDTNFHRRICLIVARIAQRNAIGLYHDRAILQEVDQELDKLQDTMSPSWWRAPLFRQGQLLDSSQDSKRLICQLWFFQARIFAHLPFGFEISTEGTSKSLEVCMEASRITLHRYIGLQHARERLSRCRTVDQSAFVAAAALLLAKVHLQDRASNSTASKYDSDRDLLEQVIDAFASAGRHCHREHTVRQSSEILSCMLQFALEPNNFHRAGQPPLASDTPSHSAVAMKPIRHTTKEGMLDIITSSIKPALLAESPASHLIDQLLAANEKALGTLKYHEAAIQSRPTFSIDDLIYPSMLN